MGATGYIRSWFSLQKKRKGSCLSFGSKLVIYGNTEDGKQITKNTAEKKLNFFFFIIIKIQQQTGLASCTINIWASQESLQNFAMSDGF